MEEALLSCWVRETGGIWCVAFEIHGKRLPACSDFQFATNRIRQALSRQPFTQAELSFLHRQTLVGEQGWEMLLGGGQRHKVQLFMWTS